MVTSGQHRSRTKAKAVATSRRAGARSARVGDSRSLPPKLTPPRPTRLYPRERLFELLDRTREDHRVIWVSAPGGAGKTSLAASYLTARELPTLWYQVDAGDGDIASFFYYMGLAAKRAAPRHKKSLPLLTPEYLADVPTFARNYFRELYRRLPGKSVLVLDNYQDAPEDSRLHDVLHIAMSEVPESINLLVLSRIEPPAVFARLRLCDHAACLDWAKMQLTPEETAGISAVRMGSGSLDDKMLATVHDRAHGWAAGVVLMLEQSKRGAPLDANQTPSDQKLLFDYFANEFLARAESSVQEFLLKTSLFRKVRVSAAQSLSEMGNAGDILETLARNNYFTVRHPGQDEDSYEYHPLFRDFLRAQLPLHHNMDELCMLCRKAGELAEQQGEIESAMELFAQARDWESTARLIIAHARTSVISGRGHSMLEWIALIPKEIRTQMPWLLYWSGICRMPFDVVLARSDLEQAFDAFRSRADSAGVFLAWSGIVHNLMHSLTRVDRLDPWIARLDELSAEGVACPTADIEDRVASNMFMALVLRQPQHPRFNAWRDRAAQVLERSNDPSLRMFTLFYFFTYSAWIGDLPRMERLLVQFQAVGASDEAEPLAQVTVKMAEAWSWINGRTEESMLRMEEGLAMARQTGVHLWDYLLMIQGTASALSAGDYEAAEKLLGRITPFVERARGMDQFYYYQERGRLALERGDVPQAIEFQQQAVSVATQTAIVFGEAQAHFGMSQVYHEAGRIELADTHLATARAFGKQLGSPLIEFMCLITEAQYAFERRDNSDGVARLRTAMALGRERGYMNFTYWRPQILSRLCATALDHGIETDYVRRLIKQRCLTPVSAGPLSDAWPFPLKLYILGRFSVLVNDKPLKFSGKSQKKPLELLKALIAHGGREVSEAKLAEALWSEADGDAAAQALATTLHRLRKLIGENAIERQEGRLSLDTRYAWVDAWAFERALSDLEQVCQKNQLDKLTILTTRLFTLYRGPFLKDEPDAPWLLNMRERLRAKFLRHLETAACSIVSHDPEQAVVCYQKALEIEPLAEGLYRGLMQVHLAQDRRAEALTTYDRCRKILASHLGISPSPDIETLARQARTH